MSWAEVKKINSNLSKSLDTLIGEKTTEIKNNKINFKYVGRYLLGDNNYGETSTTISGISGFAFVQQCLNATSYSSTSYAALDPINPSVYGYAYYKLFGASDGAGMSSGCTNATIPLANDKTYAFYGINVAVYVYKFD